MFVLKSIVSYLILPPANLALAILVGLVLLRSRPCLARRIIGTSAVLLAVLGMPVVASAMLLSLEQGLPLTPPADAPPGAIVILGGTMGRTSGPPAHYIVGGLTLERLRAGAALYRKTHLPILVTGGKLAPDAPPIAALMARSLRQDFKVPVRWIEPRSRDTWENAEFSATILRAAGIRSVYVVTNSWHERRALIAFRHTGLIATAAPTATHRFFFSFPESLLPEADAWRNSFFAFHEWIGCVWYSLP